MVRHKSDNESFGLWLQHDNLPYYFIIACEKNKEQFVILLSQLSSVMNIVKITDVQYIINKVDLCYDG